MNGSHPSLDIGGVPTAVRKALEQPVGGVAGRRMVQEVREGHEAQLDPRPVPVAEAGRACGPVSGMWGRNHLHSAINQTKTSQHRALSADPTNDTARNRGDAGGGAREVTGRATRACNTGWQMT